MNKSLSNKQLKQALKRFPKQKRNEVDITPEFIASLPVGEPITPKENTNG